MSESDSDARDKERMTSGTTDIDTGIICRANGRYITASHKKKRKLGAKEEIYSANMPRV